MVRLAGREEFISINTDFSVNDDEVDADELLYFGAEQDDTADEAGEADESEVDAGQSQSATQQSQGLATGGNAVSEDGGDEDNEVQGAASLEEQKEEDIVAYGPMRVWVLMGGDGAERHASLAAGRAVMSGMSKFRDAIVSAGLGYGAVPQMVISSYAVCHSAFGGGQEES